MNRQQCGNLVTHAAPIARDVPWVVHVNAKNIGNLKAREGMSKGPTTRARRNKFRRLAHGKAGALLTMVVVARPANSFAITRNQIKQTQTRAARKRNGLVNVMQLTVLKRFPAVNLMAKAKSHAYIQISSGSVRATMVAAIPWLDAPKLPKTPLCNAHASLIILEMVSLMARVVTQSITAKPTKRTTTLAS
jgi:hypothetical protein